MSLDGTLMSAAVLAKGSAWAHGAASRVFQGDYVFGAGLSTRQFDVTADGKQFIMIKASSRDSERVPSVVVVQHWLEELKRLVPAR